MEDLDVTDTKQPTLDQLDLDLERWVDFWKRNKLHEVRNIIADKAAASGRSIGLGRTQEGCGRQQIMETHYAVRCLQVPSGLLEHLKPSLGGC